MMTKKTLRAHLLAKTEEVEYWRKQMDKWRDRYVEASERADSFASESKAKDWWIENLEARLETEIGREAAIGKDVESGFVVLDNNTIGKMREQQGLDPWFNQTGLSSYE